MVPGQLVAPGFYIPRSGENLAGADVEAASLATLMSLQGSTSAHVHNIAFHGIPSSPTHQHDPDTPTGFSRIQSTYTSPAPTASPSRPVHVRVRGKRAVRRLDQDAGNVSLSSDDNITFDTTTSSTSRRRPGHGDDSHTTR